MTALFILLAVIAWVCTGVGISKLTLNIIRNYNPDTLTKWEDGTDLSSKDQKSLARFIFCIVVLAWPIVIFIYITGCLVAIHTYLKQR